MCVRPKETMYIYTLWREPRFHPTIILTKAGNMITCCEYVYWWFRLKEIQCNTYFRPQKNLLVEKSYMNNSQTLNRMAVITFSLNCFISILPLLIQTWLQRPGRALHKSPRMNLTYYHISQQVTILLHWGLKCVCIHICATYIHLCLCLTDQSLL